MYVPLRNREEVMMPYVKPRFESHEGRLRKVDAPLDLLRHSIDQPEALLDFMRRHDDFYSAYEEFQRFGFTPLANGANRALRKLRSAQKLYLPNDPSDGERLLVKLLIQFRDELAEENRRLVLLMLPDRNIVDASNAWQVALIRHRRLRNLLAANNLDFVDPREALRTHPGDKMFIADGIHYTTAGNKVVAAELAPLIHRLRAARAGSIGQAARGPRPAASGSRG